ncbi:MAG: endo-1,4-beta-xylanase [Lachnospiraceae bacterium]|nr:endo-1,4-beta-xylanase [Lachnospiraceae bacterium]
MSLSSAFEKYFKIGAAISVFDLQKPNRIELLKNEFSSFTAENDMKPMYWLDKDVMLADPEKYNLNPVINADRAVPYLELAKTIGMPMRGHTLCWHNQTPKWFYYKNYDAEGELADKETMLTRLDNYIHAVLDFVNTNYPGIIYAWDVVNEVVDEGDFRKSIWYQICGFDFIRQAFKSARKYAAPGVALFYNDYESATEWKRDFIIANVLKPLMEDGTIDGMGMQSHLVMDHPTMDEFKVALEMYGALGLEVQVTELDIHNADPSEESMHALAERYKALFEVLVNARKEGKANLTAVTFWNLLDETSWLTGFRRETSYPLLFHKEGEKKEAYFKVLEVVE